MKAIYKREMSSFFHSPMGWVLLAIGMGISGFFFTMAVSGGYVDMAQIYTSIEVLLLLVMPILTMRLFAEEKKGGTEVLLYTTPTSLLRVVIGKYLAAMTQVGIIMSITIVHAIAAAVMGGLVGAAFAGTAVAFFMVFSVFVALGIFISASTENQIIAAVVGMITSFFFLFLYDGLASALQGMVSFVLSLFKLSPEASANAASAVYGFFSWLNPITKMNNINRGVFELPPLFFALSLTAFFIFLTYRLLEKRRWTQS